MSKNTLIGISVLAVVVVAGALYYFLVYQKQVTVAPLEREESLGSDLFDKTENPGSTVPDTNPFEKVQANPLQGTNPFEGGYQNPFE